MGVAASKFGHGVRKVDLAFEREHAEGLCHRVQALILGTWMVRLDEEPPHRIPVWRFVFDTSRVRNLEDHRQQLLDAHGRRLVGCLRHQVRKMAVVTEEFPSSGLLACRLKDGESTTKSVRQNLRQPLRAASAQAIDHAPEGLVLGYRPAFIVENAVVDEMEEELEETPARLEPCTFEEPSKSGGPRTSTVSMGLEQGRNAIGRPAVVDGEIGDRHVLESIAAGGEPAGDQSAFVGEVEPGRRAEELPPSELRHRGRIRRCVPKGGERRAQPWLPNPPLILAWIGNLCEKSERDFLEMHPDTIVGEKLIEFARVARTRVPSKVREHLTVLSAPKEVLLRAAYKGDECSPFPDKAPGEAVVEEALVPEPAPSPVEDEDALGGNSIKIREREAVHHLPGDGKLLRSRHLVAERRHQL